MVYALFFSQNDMKKLTKLEQNSLTTGNKVKIIKMFLWTKIYKKETTAY